MLRLQAYRADLLTGTHEPVIAELVLSYLLDAGPTVARSADGCVQSVVRASVTHHITSGNAIGVWNTDGLLVGYAAWDVFDFHGELAGFCPLAAHASVATHDPDVHEFIYTTLADSWVRRGIRKHLFQISAHRPLLERRFYEIGFGRYVVDAVRALTAQADEPSLTHSPGPPETVSIRRAGRDDADALARLIHDSISSYANSPIFLCFEPSSDGLDPFLTVDSGAVYVAERFGEVVGFMGVRLVPDSDAGVLVAAGDATLDGIGAYLAPEIRNMRVGSALVKGCFEWARQHGARRLHVDYESANPAARAFWPRHFTPQAHSLMRVVHADAVEPVHKT